MKVSIIIPVYNVEKYLAQCLDSAVNQTLDEIEIIAINDGSTDNSLNILREYERRYSCIKVISKENGGQGIARNIGVNEATGEYIYFLDSDDFILHNNIMEYCYNLAKDHFLDIISFDAIDIKDEDGQLYQLFHTKSNRKDILQSTIKSGEDYFIEAVQKEAYKPEVCLNFYSKNLFAENNIRFPEDRVFEDVPFSISVYIKAKKVLYIPYEFYFRRIREGSTTSGYITEKKIYSIIKNGKSINEFLLENRCWLQSVTQEILSRQIKECYDTAFAHCAMLYVEEEKRNLIYKDIHHSLITTVIGQNKDKEIKVSIIIPVYNVEKYLRQCLDSALNQTIEGLEVLAVNDGSTDNSLEILQEYEKKYSILKIINKENGGLSSARNAGLEQAKGEYVYFLDSDDWLSNNDIIEYCYNTASHNSLDIINFDCMDMYDDGVNIYQFLNTDCSRKDILESSIIDGETFYNQCKEKSAFKYAVWLNLYNKNFLLQNHLSFRKNRIYEDVPFNTSAFVKAKRVLYVPYQFYLRRVRNGSITSTMPNEKNVKSLINNGKDIQKFYLDNINIINESTKKHLISAIEECFNSALYHCERIEIDESKRKSIKNDIELAMTSLEESINEKKKVNVSIIIPVYNVERYLVECLNSAVNQSLDNIEVIAINDGSTDGSLEILKDYEKRYSNLKIINKANGGLGSARNVALDQAIGDYIYFMDSDDYLFKNDILEYCYNTAKSNNLDILTFDSFDMYDDGDQLYYMTKTNCNRKDILESRIINGEAFYNECIDKNVMKYSVCLCLYKREFLEFNELRFKEDRIYEDVTFNIAAFIKAQSIYYVPYQFYIRRVWKGSITSTEITEKNIDSLINNAEDIYNFYLENKDYLCKNTNEGLIKNVNECYNSAFINCSSLRLTMDEHRKIMQYIQESMEKTKII